MKTIKKVSWVMAVLVLGSVTLFAQKKEINAEESVVQWTGKKIGKAHHGEVKLQSGYFNFNDGDISGGEVIMDMATITNHDLDNEEFNAKLVGHLKSDDFFGVETFPTAKFVVTGATGFNNGKATVTGELTIKGKTEPVSFDVEKKGDLYSAQVIVDRSKFDVRYGSDSFFDNLGDSAIDDNFILKIDLAM
ncbi:MAG: YceI family protein [Bacteroidales bacterium]